MPATVVQIQNIRLTLFVDAVTVHIKLIRELRRQSFALANFLKCFGQFRANFDMRVEIRTRRIVANVNVEVAITVHIRNSDGRAGEL